MPIEVTSLPEQSGMPRLLQFIRRLIERALPPFAYSFSHAAPLSKRQLLLRSIPGLLAIALVAGGDSLLRSYKYYSRIIDARLASGYLSSRPGLYASPRTIHAGQNISRSGLVENLRRAGYLESDQAYGNIAWNGSFRETPSAIEIRPVRRSSRPSVVRATFGSNTDQNTISELTGDDLPLPSFTLEPEVLSNDLSYKAGKRETVRYSELPPVLVQAILSIEDHRFFQHSGVDLWGIGRALLRNAGDERVGQGGSTITQQLVKNTYLTPEKTLRRKYAEAMLAFALERRLLKQDIFALYCNEVYLGQRGAVAARGVREAAHLYFDKELKDLSLGEAATLAGMIQGPVRYSPVKHLEAAQRRRDMVLEAMVRDGWIDRGEAALAMVKPVAVSGNPVSNDSVAPYFVDYVNRRLEPVGESHTESQEVSAGSRRVYTTIDLNLQQLAENAIKKQLARLDAVNRGTGAKPQAALVALDPRTGNVLAMVGGRDYAHSQLNRVTDALRQPGSTFKPFVYAAALEDGMSPVQQFADAPREFVYDRNKSYRPANFGGGYSMRDVTMRDGLVRSLNIVTVDVAMQTGLARIANLAAQFGLPRPERYPSLALGTEEVTPLRLAAAYATFANGGRRVQPRVIAAVGEPPVSELPNTEINNETEQVISPTTAYMVTNMLSDVIQHGTGAAARDAVKGTAIAGKTGTSRDGWFVGYTQNLVCVVWIGFDDNRQLGLTGAAAALPAWTDFMSAAIELRPELGGENFECPEGIKFVEIDIESGLRSTLTCPRRELIAVTDRLMPNLECFEHGNLPELKELVPESPRDAEDKTILAQHAPARLRLVRPNETAQFAATHVDVDKHGRRTLVNDMR
jgi:penicillin-binding protein 1B